MSNYKIGDNLREARMEKGYKLDYVERMLGISKSSLSKYENSISEPPFNSLVMLADLYGVSLDYLFSRNVNVISEDKSVIRISNKSFTLVNMLYSEEYISLAKFLEGDPKQRLKMVKNKLNNYIQ